MIICTNCSVTNAFRSAFRTKADSPTEASNPSFWEFLEFDTYYPIANFTDRPFRRKTNGKLDVVNDIALQGTFDTLRRDYSKLFSDLQRLLKGTSGMALLSRTCFSHPFQ